MMKKLVFFAVLFAAATGFGAMVEQDMLDLRVQGSMNFSNAEGHVETELGLGLGYFVLDDIQAGGLIDFANDQSKVGFGFGVFSDIMFDLYYAAAPFVGAAAKYRFGDFYKHNHFLIELNGGVRVFLTEYLAITGLAFFELATNDVYESNYKYRNHDAGLRLGLNVYF